MASSHKKVQADPKSSNKKKPPGISWRPVVTRHKRRPYSPSRQRWRIWPYRPMAMACVAWP